MTPQQKRRFTLALHAYCRAKTISHKWDHKNLKFKRHFEKAEAKLYHVADTLKDIDLKKCTCPASWDHTFNGHLPSCKTRN